METKELYQITGSVASVIELARLRDPNVSSGILAMIAVKALFEKLTEAMTTTYSERACGQEPPQD